MRVSESGPPMTPAPRKTMLETLTGAAALPEEVRRAPKKRQEEKVKNSAVGWIIVLLGIAVLVLVGLLAYQTRNDPNLTFLGGGVMVSSGLMVFGGLVADRETFGPVAAAFVGLVLRARKAKE